MKTERKSNFELLRIIAMFLIILFHCSIHSSFNTELNDVSFAIITRKLVGVCGIAGNVIFTLISGYFLVNNKEIKIKKILQLIFQVWIYSIIFLIIFFKFNLLEIGLEEIIKNVFPLTFQTNWYVTFYFVLYILSPYINKLLKVLDKTSFKKMLLIMFVFWCVLSHLKSNLFFSSKFTYYIFVYCVGAYIRLYENDITISKKRTLFYLILTLFLTIIITVLVYILGLKWYKIYEIGIARIFSTHQNIFQFLIGLFMFLLFKNLNIKHNKIINSISSCTLGIYLLHENYFVRKYIWTDILKLELFQNRPIIVFYIFVFCIEVFIVCLIIELIRKNTIEKLYMKFIEKNEEKINKFFNWIYLKFNNILLYLGLTKKDNQ